MHTCVFLTIIGKTWGLGYMLKGTACGAGWTTCMPWPYNWQAVVTKENETSRQNMLTQSIKRALQNCTRVQTAVNLQTWVEQPFK